MDWSAVVAIASRDARAGLRNRWFILYAIVFLVLSVGFSWVALAGTELTGQAGFGRTSAGLLNLMLALRGAVGSPGDFILLVVLTVLLGLGMLSVGYLISSFSPQTAAALGIAVSLWLVFVIIGDLGLMGSSLVMRLQPSTLLMATLMNPLDTYKILSVDLLQSSMEVLGPAGVYAIDRFGAALAPVLLAAVSLWILAPLPIGYWLFRRVDVR